MRDSLNNVKNKTENNKSFFIIGTWVTKVFYVWAKHYIGFFLNYVRFLDRANDEQIYHIYLLLIFSGFATTISMFLHTLKFKRYIGPKTSFTVYVISYLATFYSFARIYEIFFLNLDLTIIVLIGLVLNFTHWKYQNAYQFFLLFYFNASRYDLLPSAITLQHNR